MDGLFRIIDANINRAQEGLRVIEDFYRYRFDEEDKEAHKRLRTLRHRFSEVARSLTESYPLLKERDTDSDEGRSNSISSYREKSDLVYANFQRVKQALRVIEEAMRLVPDIGASELVREIRFLVYDLERELLGADIDSSGLDRRGLLRKTEGTVRLYLIYDLDLLKGMGVGNKRLYGFARELLEAGVDIFQLRFSLDIDDALVLDLAKALVAMTEGTDRLIFVNNRADIARLSAANLHIGQRDIPPADARRIVSETTLIGLSCHSDEEILKAQELPVDYFTIGPIFKTATKPDYKPVGIKLVERWHRLEKPFVVIGGITLENLSPILEFGPMAVCVCRDILCAEDPLARVRQYKAVLSSIEK